MKKENKEEKPVILNKKARFNFEILQTFEAGIVLHGTEVKSLRENKGNLTDAFARVRNGEIFLDGFQISLYKNQGYATHDQVRSRKLLLHKKEINRIEKKIKEKGLTLVACKAYFKGQYLKVEIALAKPKKLYDKRETLKKKESNIDIQRALKSRSR